MSYSLEVLVKSAVNLPNVEITGKSDPYVLLAYQGQKKQTKVIDDELNPSWNETLTFDLQTTPLLPTDELVVTVKDFDKVTPDKLMAKATVPLKGVISSGRMEVKLPLLSKDGKELASTLELSLVYKKPSAPSGGAGGTAAGGGGTTTNQTGGGSANGAAAGGAGGTGTDSGAFESDISAGVSFGDVTGDTSIAAGTGVKRKQHEPYSTKADDYQIRVKIIEARQLQGGNITPICKVVCAGKNRETRVKSPTHSPYWDEIFFFNFHESPAKLFDQLIQFSVYNARKLRQDSLIGSFKFDLSLAYEQDKHALLNKWLLLSDPEDPMSGPRGYLKISLLILGPGDEPFSLKADDSDEQDIEANLLRPAGVQLRPAVLKIRLYKAEDLPQMDPDTFGKMSLTSKEEKEYVDPYVEFSFAGTKIKSSKKYETANPEWNEEVVLNHQFPSMCEKLKFTVFDWDRVGNNDAVATGTILMSNISAFVQDDEGFLPTFGPCFINLYGSPREYSDMPNKYESLNLGKGDGAAYRGRVLLEVRTELLSDPVANEVRAIDNDSIARVQKVLRRRRFRVHAAFLSASLIPGEKDSPIQFEVSVGNYGNILDDSVPPCASTTPPTNPVYDGVAYSYLPWGEEKPMCLLESHWEDVTYRMCAVNVLLKAADRMTNSITRVQLSVKNDFPLEQQARDVIDALDQFILDCSVELPVSEPEQSPTNELDMHLRILREGQLKSLHDQAVHLRNTAEDIEQTLQQMIFFRDTLLGIAAEPQLSFPDVIIWMLSGSKRSAYCRIPAHDVMYHPNPNYCGRACGVPQTLMFKRPKLEEESGERYLRAPVMVRVIVWLGLDKYQQAWNEATVEARTQIVAETYENQGKILNKWVTTKPPLTRPAWSDAQGKKELKKESFVPPPGWRWDGDWFVHPDVSILYHKDTNQTSFVEDVYVNQSRTPNGNWEPAQIPYSDAYGEPKRAPENIQLRDDWTWEGDWEVDKDRLCDEDGWEYAQGSTDTTFTSAEKNYCMFRRKRMIRKRVKGEAGMPVKQAILGSVLSQDKEQRVALLESFSGVPEERWEYAFNFSSKFHDREKTMDAVRRRRWHRIMVPGGDESGSVVMQLKAEDKPAEHTQKTRKKKNMTVPRIYLQYERSHIWHLRVYLFQARNLLAADQSGMSDPYVQCSFQGMCQRTPTLQGTICPVFDQTIMYEQVEMHGSVTRITRYPPPVVLEFFDWDKVGTNEYLGRCQILPVIKTDISEKHAARLQWFSITKGDRDGGELLAAAELLLLDGRDPPAPPKRRGDLYAVPDNVRPVLRRKGIEILCWGVRNMAKYQLASVNSPSVEFEINGVVRESNVIKSVKHHPNFKDPFLFLDVMLPEEPAYMPPLNISVRDHRAFGQKPRVGIHVLQDMSSYQVDPRTTKFDPILNIPSLAEPVPAALDSGPQPTPTETGKPSKDAKLTKKKKFLTTSMLDLEQIDDDVDWWSKLYASLGEWDRCLKYNELGYDKLKVYTKELEKVKEFRGFLDFCNTFTLTKGKNVDEDEDNFAGEFKGNFRIYDLPEDPTSPLPMRYFDQSNLCTDPEEVVVRVYVVRGMDLQPSDPSGLADPYVEVRIGDKKVNSKKNYVPNTLNPEFGRMFQLKVRLPIEKDLKIRVMDYDVIGADDVIGETTIDLENRRLTKYRATCGVPQSYCISGPNQWRDSKTPTAILEDVCKLYNLPSPQYDEPTDQNMPISCRVGNRNLSLDQFERGMIYNAHLGPAKERLALHILNMLPIVKEHVETRSLYSSLQPNTPQGQLQMWVDIFPVAFGEPGPAVDITPRVPDEYVLRVVVWNTYEVILQEANIFGEKMSDIYVKGWISGVDERQKTDVHYRSLDGEGNFNWRFVFPFLYLPSENMVVVKKKEHFWSLDTRETRCRPSLVMQVWDNDLFNPDDFLGTLELQLSNMPIPAKNAKSCNLNMMNSVSQDMKMVNLFDCKRVKGFWPFMNEDHGNQVLTGKIEMEMEVVTKAEEAVRPAGRARDEVNENPHLEPPNRPETSFLWFTSPWKTFKFIIWKKCKWIFIGILIAVLLGLLIALFIYAIPQLLARKMVGV